MYRRHARALSRARRGSCSRSCTVSQPVGWHHSVRLTPLLAFKQILGLLSDTFDAFVTYTLLDTSRARPFYALTRINLSPKRTGVLSSQVR